MDCNRTERAAVASAVGVKSWRVEDPEKLEGVLREALNHDGPTLVDITAPPRNHSDAPVSAWVSRPRPAPVT